MCEWVRLYVWVNVIVCEWVWLHVLGVSVIACVGERVRLCVSECDCMCEWVWLCVWVSVIVCVCECDCMCEWVWFLYVWVRVIVCMSECDCMCEWVWLHVWVWVRAIACVSECNYMCVWVRLYVCECDCTCERGWLYVNIYLWMNTPCPGSLWVWEQTRIPVTRPISSMKTVTVLELYVVAPSVSLAQQVRRGCLTFSVSSSALKLQMAWCASWMDVSDTWFVG